MDRVCPRVGSEVPLSANILPMGGKGSKISTVNNLPVRSVRLLIESFFEINIKRGTLISALEKRSSWTLELVF